MRGAEAHDDERDFHLILTAFLCGDRRCPGPRYIRLARDDDILTARFLAEHFEISARHPSNLDGRKDWTSVANGASVSLPFTGRVALAGSRPAGDAATVGL